MTNNLTEAEKAFLDFDWAASQSWQLYYSNLFPTPPLSKVPKYKRTWYRRNVDKTLPPDSTVGDPVSASAAAPPTANRNRHTSATTPTYRPTNRGFFTGASATKDLLARFELYARIAFLVSTLTTLMFRFLRFLPVNIFVKASKVSTASFFLFLILTLIKDKGRPRMSMDWAQAVFTDEHMHYLSYGAAVFNLPKTILFTAPQLLTCLFGLHRLYKYHIAAFPRIVNTQGTRELSMQLDIYSLELYKLRAALEAATLFHMVLALFTGSSAFMNFVLYTNFIKLKISIHDVYLLSVFRQINGAITGALSHGIVPSGIRTAYRMLVSLIVKYFTPRY